MKAESGKGGRPPYYREDGKSEPRGGLAGMSRARPRSSLQVSGRGESEGPDLFSRRPHLTKKKGSLEEWLTPVTVGIWEAEAGGLLALLRSGVRQAEASMTGKLTAKYYSHHTYEESKQRYQEW